MHGKTVKTYSLGTLQKCLRWTFGIWIMEYSSFHRLWGNNWVSFRHGNRFRDAPFGELRHISPARERGYNIYSVHLVGNKQNNRGKAYQVLLGDVKLIKSYPIQKPRVPVSNVIIIASLLFPYYFFVLVLFWSRNLTRWCVWLILFFKGSIYLYLYILFVGGILTHSFHKKNSFREVCE